MNLKSKMDTRIRESAATTMPPLGYYRLPWQRTQIALARASRIFSAAKSASA
jgi:hypothetical protein